MGKTRGVLTVGMVVAITIASAPVFAQRPLAQTTAGVLEGVWVDDVADIAVYRGVPFAQPPVDDLRWRPPVPVEAWDGRRVADAFGPACWQARNADNSPYARGELPRSEDCLTLNVWTPAQAGEARPVMVWFHGGGHSSGVGSAKIFDGTAMARKGVLMVTANYRLGPLGFLAHPSLSAESTHGASGNYGILDHIATLQWVRDNIAAFGGDPSNVTIFGQSAGSWSVCALQASPLADGLFHKAIGHSGGCFGAPRPHLDTPGGVATEGSGHDAGKAIAAALDVTGEDAAAAAALRRVDPEAVLEARSEAGVGTGVVVDGWVLPVLPGEIFRGGNHNDVPVMIGSMSDEGTTLYAGMAEPPQDDFEVGIRSRYGDQGDAILAAYATDIHASTRTAGQAIQADRNFTWQLRAWARAVGETNDVYLYFFSHAPPVFRLYLPDRPKLHYAGGQRSAGAYHSGDLAYAFGNVGVVGVDWNARDYEISEQMSQYWVNFATTGNPNGDGLPVWPKYDRDGEGGIEFATYGTGAASKVRERKLDLFDASYGLESVATGSVETAATRTPRNAEEFDALFDEVKNWGRWGADDERGTVNLITAEKSRQATALVDRGITVSLSHNPMPDVAADNPDSAFNHTMAETLRSDTYEFSYHGYGVSHIDSLCHFLHKGRMYNGVPASASSLEAGCSRLGIQNLKDGVVSRGILLDIPRLKGVPYLEPGTPIYAEDLEAWIEQAGVTMAPGDIVLLRTGRWARRAEEGPWQLSGNSAGLHASAIRWVREHDVAIFGSDAASDVQPTGVEDVRLPVHTLLIAALGTNILDNMDLEALAETAAAENRWEFLLMAGPIPVEGGTGSPLNAIAVF